jgi:hypothetical protein
MTTTSSPTPMDPIEERRKEVLVYYQFCYPVEKLFYETLRAHYPGMTVMDISVCRAAYIEVRTGGSPMYERRMIWTFHNTPGSEMPRYVLENAALLLGPGQSCRTLEEARKIVESKLRREGIEEVEDIPIFPTDHSFENAVGLAYMRGYLEGSVTDRPFLRINKEIQKLLDEALDQAVSTQDYVTDEQVFQHEREEAEFDRRYHSGLS